MDYIKIRFGKDLERMRSRLQRTIDEMFQEVRPMMVYQPQTWRPEMDLFETENEVIVVAEVSGVAPEALEVEADANALKIAGNRQQAHTGHPGKYHLAEISYGPFERILYLPAAVDPEKGEASYTNGILKIVLPKQTRPQIRHIVVDIK
jgi:HSP20 family protein